MDHGAHFYKCDFQVHTPRDNNWIGERPLTDDDRKSYADDFVKACREKGINAVAITDHHDFAFFNYIKNSASNELDSTGTSIPIDKKLIVFPGVELTLSTPPCQAIAIMDADYPPNNLNQILHLFAITPNGDTEATTIETTPITNEIVNSFEELYKKLNTIETLRGRFIVFPNLNEGGRHTLLRAGNAEQYRKMPCVGGYVDGAITQHGTGNTNIVNGIAREWGYKNVAVFQTSDNRRRDFSDLGNHITWVKWAIPTAEALRQACLAKESRLSLVTPELPQTYIKKLDVTNSKFLGSFSFDFNQQYTSLIGGRGTGKSTILEYLRWGLCDQTFITFDPEQHSEIEKRRQSLIEKTLIPFNGEVRVTFSLNGIDHIIKKNSTTKDILLKIADGEFELVKEDEIRRILPIQAYSQKQLSNVGVRTEELKRFIQQPITTQLNNLKFKLTDNAKKTRSSYNSFVRKKEIQNEVEEFKLEIRSLNNQVENLRKSLSGISKEDQEIISQKSKIDSEQSLISTVQAEFLLISTKVDELIVSLEKYPEPFPTDIEIENEDIMTSINRLRKEKFDELTKHAKQVQTSLNEENMKELNRYLDKWSEKKGEFETKYESAKEKTSSNQQQINEIQRIEKRLQELSSTFHERNAVLKDMGDSAEEFNNLREEWYSMHQSKVNLLKEQAKEFSQLSKGLIKAEITKSIDISQLKTHLLSAVSGTRIREERIQNLCDFILKDENPLEAWKNILSELRQLAELKISEEKKLSIPETAVLNECGFNEKNITRIIEIMTPENWLDIATTEIEFNPDFKYTTSNQMGDVIPFSEASAGQQATALLTVLLNQPGTPLLIDQPEDDIDNRAINEIINNIWNAKKKRQLIFTSHNANLVVNGDSELVICCDYREAGDQTRGIIKAKGAIDSKNVKDEITSVMEGGEKAFRLRKDKYGF
ncbi:MAG: AAA family ATPase [Candidatus Scalindua sp.]|nr:AAA family ATPase [Candidatus Scalindua sp.]